MPQRDKRPADPGPERTDVVLPLALVLVIIVVLVDNGADPTIALSTLVAAVAAVGRLRG